MLVFEPLGQVSRQSVSSSIVHTGGAKSSPAYNELLDLVRSLFGQYTEIIRKLFKANLSVIAQGKGRKTVNQSAKRLHI